MASRTEVLPEPLSPQISVSPAGIRSSACSMQRTSWMVSSARLTAAGSVAARLNLAAACHLTPSPHCTRRSDGAVLRHAKLVGPDPRSTTPTSLPSAQRQRRIRLLTRSANLSAARRPREWDAREVPRGTIRRHAAARATRSQPDPGAREAVLPVSGNAPGGNSADLPAGLARSDRT